MILISAFPADAGLQHLQVSGLRYPGFSLCRLSGLQPLQVSGHGLQPCRSTLMTIGL